MAARIKHINHTQKTRDRIQASQLINRLENHVLNDVDMSASQVNAAKILLGKVIPDMKQIEATVEVLKHEDALDELE